MDFNWSEKLSFGVRCLVFEVSNWLKSHIVFFFQNPFTSNLQGNHQNHVLWFLNAGPTNKDVNYGLIFLIFILALKFGLPCSLREVIGQILIQQQGVPYLCWTVWLGR